MTENATPFSQSGAQLKVLDLGMQFAGPFAATLLGDFGAEVIKCEQPGLGDLARLGFADGVASFRLDAGARVVAELARDGRVCCIVDQRPFEAAETSCFNTRSAMLHGTARRIEAARDGEACFVLEVEKVVSFDFAKLQSNPASLAQ